MQDPFVIDKATYKIMKYIYRHHEVTLGKIREKFGDEGLAIATYLCPEKFAVYRTENKQFTYDITHTSADGTILLTIAGNKYVEDRMSSFTQWMIPIAISLFALAISAISLVLSFNNEIFVHLIK